MKNKKYYIYKYRLSILNFLSLLALIILIGLTIILIKFNVIKNINFDANKNVVDFEFFFFIIIMILWMVLHEIIHGLSYIINGASKKSICYGVELEKGVFYTTCKNFITKKNILISSIMPFMLIGVITYIIGLLCHNIFLVALSIINISGSVADLSLFLFLLKLPSTIKYKETNDSTGFCIASSKDLKNIKSFSIKLQEELKKESDIPEYNKKNIYISPTSKTIIYIILIILLIALAGVFI